MIFLESHLRVAFLVLGASAQLQQTKRISSGASFKIQPIERQHKPQQRKTEAMNATAQTALFNAHAALDHAVAAVLAPTATLPHKIIPRMPNVPPAQKGTRGVLMELEPGSIKIDSGTYQRPPVMPHALKIALEWDWNAYQPISVSQRPDGSLWCYDGQHRLLASQARGDIKTLPCWVVFLSGPEEEAKHWLRVNIARRRVKPMEEFNARATAKDFAHEWLTKFLDSRGLRPSQKKVNLEPGDCTAINACVKLLNRKTTADSMNIIRMTFDVMRDAWGHEPRAYSGRAIEGMLRLMTRLSVTSRANLCVRASERLGRWSLVEILDQADAAARARGGAVLADLPMIYVEKFNFRQRTDLLMV